MAFFKRVKRPVPVRDGVFAMFQRVYLEGYDCRGMIEARRVVNGWIESVTVRVAGSEVLITCAPQVLRAL